MPAFEFTLGGAQFNTPARMRELVARAEHAGAGLLLDNCHIVRSRDSGRDIEDVAPSEIVYVQFREVGAAPFPELFGAFAAKGHSGPFSHEAPNHAAWARPAGEIAREALAASRAVLP